MGNAGLEEAQAGIKFAGRNINNLRYADNTTLMAESEELNSLDESKRREWKIWLKAQHSKNKDHGIWSHQFGHSVMFNILQTMDWITPDFPVHHKPSELT